MAVARTEHAEIDADEFGADEPTEPWHNSTPAVLGASALGLAVIAALVGIVMWVSTDDSVDPPVNFVDPSFAESASSSTTATTTPTITSTVQVSTTEINPPLTPTSPADTSDSSSSSSTATTRTPRTRENDDSETSWPRRPRYNETRTFLPRPVG